MRLKLDIAPDLLPVCISDPPCIGQVLPNILSNAVKFTESGSVALSVAHDGQAVFFAVNDSGIGMSDEQVACCSRHSTRPMPRPRAVLAAPAWAWRSVSAFST